MAHKLLTGYFYLGIMSLMIDRTWSLGDTDLGRIRKYQAIRGAPKTWRKFGHWRIEEGNPTRKVICRECLDFVTKGERRLKFSRWFSCGQKLSGSLHFNRKLCEANIVTERDCRELSHELDSLDMDDEGGQLIEQLEQVDSALFNLQETEVRSDDKAAKLAAQTLLMQVRLLAVRAIALREKTESLARLSDDKLAAALSKVDRLQWEFNALTDNLADATREYFSIFGSTSPSAIIIRRITNRGL